jgi:hypothetical protein
MVKKYLIFIPLVIFIAELSIQQCNVTISTPAISHYNLTNEIIFIREDADMNKFLRGLK